MFVTIIFDTEYMGMAERHKWFLKNLSHAKENDWLIITHEYLGKHYHEYLDNCAERFFNEFEMHRLDDEEYEEISKGFVPDKIFEKKEKAMGSRTEFLMYLFSKSYPELERCMIQMIDAELKKRPGERVEAIFNCLDCYTSIKNLGKHYNCPVIPYVFSAIRKVHGYQTTLYMTSMDGSLCSCDDGLRRYKKFENEKQDQKVFSRRELLTIFGKENNIPLLKLLNCEGDYEIGICTDAYRVQHNFLTFQYTDDDIFYECKKNYPVNEIKIRMHPMEYDKMGIGREKLRNDPVSFILSCKRVTGLQSQILLKAMMWNRTVYMKGDFSQFSFLSEKDVKSTKKIGLVPLNYYILGLLIPSELMFNIGYWRWRIDENPTEHEIYNMHLEHCLKSLGLDFSILHSDDEKGRFSYLLHYRKCSEELIKDLLDENIPNNINFDVLMSKIDIGKGSVVKYSLNRINQYINEKVYSKFDVYCEELMDFIRFYPFVDVGGNAKIKQIKIDGVCILNNGKVNYYSKANGYEEYSKIKVLPGKHIIDVEWEYVFM